MMHTSKDAQAQALDLELLTGEGFSFRLGDEYLHIPPPSLGTLLRIARLGLRLPSVHIGEDTPQEELLALGWQVVAESAETMAEVVALALWGSKPTGGKDFVALRLRILEGLTASELFAVVQGLYISCNLADFINATRLVQTHQVLGGRVATED